MAGCLWRVTTCHKIALAMQAKLEEHPLFERISDEDLEQDAAAGLLTDATEEGQKVARNSGNVGSAP